MPKSVIRKIPIFSQLQHTDKKRRKRGNRTLSIFRKIQEVNKKKIRWLSPNRLRLDPHRWQVMGDSQTHPNKGIIPSKHTQELVGSAKERINNVLVIGGPGSGKS